ncbi:MAG: magnesium/cobalt transporter CorA [Acidobacteria bacterium]|nr:magnesium/cobalt transporter CorA [Acidobacteriota bacterium]
MSGAGVQTEPGVINSRAYRGGLKVAEVPVSDIPAALAHEDWFIWIGLYEPTEELLKTVQQAFGLHDLAIEDAHSAHQRTKLENYDDSVFLVLRTVQLAGEPRRLDFGETHVFVGKRYIVSVRHGSLKSHLGVRQKCEATPTLLARGPGFVLHALMDFIVDQYFPVVETLEQELVDLEKNIFAGRFSQETTNRVYNLMRDLISLKRAISPLADVSNHLARVDCEVVPPDTRPYFGDVNDHVLRIMEMIETVQQLSSTALEAHLALASVAQNEDTKRLAAWAAILAVPTMIAGLYGMNFENIPELHWRFGYPFSIAFMFLVCLLLYRGFKRSGWL